MNSKAQKADQAEAREELREILTPGTTVYTILRHVSRSGMQRAIDLFIIVNGEPLRITWTACRAAGRTYSRKHEAAIADGCGMDMGYHLVNCLSYALHGMDAKNAGNTLAHRWL